MEDIDLNDIEDVDASELSKSRLETLENGHDSFEDVLASNSDPITLDGSSGIPYSIIDGRHRIYLARERGYTSVTAQIE